MASEHERELPRQIGNFTLLEKLDSGASSHAYLARDNRSGEDIALKLSDESGWGTYLFMGPERLDGIITKLVEQSSYDSNDVDFINERLKEKLPPNQTLAQFIEAATVKATASDSKESEKHLKDTNFPQSSSDHRGEANGQNGQPPAKDSGLTEVLARDLQLPDYLFNDFKSLLKKMHCTVEEGKTPGPRGRSYTLVKNMKGTPRALIYIRGDILNDPNPYSQNTDAVSSLCIDFNEIPSPWLIVFTEVKYCDPTFENIVEKQWSKIKMGKIVFWQRIKKLEVEKEIEQKKFWIKEILEMEI